MTAMTDRPGGPVRSVARHPRRTADRRRARVDAGAAELLVWTADQLATGLARLQPEAHRRFDLMGARLVDAQAPGLAGRVRGLAGVTASGPGWNDRLLGELALLYALACAHQRLDGLPEALAATIRAHVGYPVRKASVAQGPAVPDAWSVIGRRDENDGVLTTRRTWLVGQGSGRCALVLAFATRAEHLDDSLALGTVVLADLHFYPGSLPMRALVGDVHGVLGAGAAGTESPAPPPPPCGMTVAQARRHWSAWLERDPWVRRTALVLAVAPVPPADSSPEAAGSTASEASYWRDAAGEVLAEDPRTGGGPPLPSATEAPELPDLRWVALAVGGGEPVPLCAEMADGGMTPLAVWTPTGVVPAPSAGGRPPATREAPAHPAWDDLVAAATIGIDPATALPSSVLACLPGMEDDGPDAADRTRPGPVAALEAAALLHAGRRGGLGPGLRTPAPRTVSAYPRAPDHPEPNRRLLPHAAAERILAHPPEVAAELAAQAADAGLAVPTAALAHWLAYAARHAWFACEAAPMMGARGRWLADANPAWRTAAMPATQSLDFAFGEYRAPAAGTSRVGAVERSAWFRQARRELPGPSRDRLEQAFAGLPSAIRLALLKQLVVGLAAADRPFLTTAASDRSRPVRELAAGLLSALGGTAGGTGPAQTVAALADCSPSEHRRAGALIEVLWAARADPASSGVADRYAGLPPDRAVAAAEHPADELAAWPGHWPRALAEPGFAHLQARMRRAPPDAGDHRAARLLALRAAPQWLRPRLADVLALTPGHSRWRPVLIVADNLADLRQRLEEEPS